MSGVHMRLAALAKAEADETVVQAYGTEMKFGPDYVIPKPFGPRLLAQLAPAVAKAAMDSALPHAPLRTLTPIARGCQSLLFNPAMQCGLCLTGRALIPNVSCMRRRVVEGASGGAERRG